MFHNKEVCVLIVSTFIWNNAAAYSFLDKDREDLVVVAPLHLIVRLVAGSLSEPSPACPQCLFISSLVGRWSILSPFFWKAWICVSYVLSFLGWCLICSWSSVWDNGADLSMGVTQVYLTLCPLEHCPYLRRLLSAQGLDMSGEKDCESQSVRLFSAPLSACEAHGEGEGRAATRWHGHTTWT